MGRRFNIFLCPVCFTTALYPGQCVEGNNKGQRHEGDKIFVTRDRIIVEEVVGAAGTHALSRLQQPAGVPGADGEEEPG